MWERDQLLLPSGFSHVNNIFNNERSTDNGNKLRTFRKFKTNVKEERYLTEIKDTITRNNITKLRIGAHNLLYRN